MQKASSCYRKLKTLLAEKERGFSILEVLVTAAIIGIITGIIAFNYGSFNNSILLKNQAFQVALDLREMQTRALSSYGDSSTFRNPYGVYFSTGASNQYILFIDDGDGVFEIGEELEVRNLDSRFLIDALCNGSDCTLSDLSVTFVRPNFDAVMMSGVSNVASGEVQLISITGNDATRSVMINATGQITVE